MEKLNSKEKYYFAKQLSDILESSVAVEDGLQLLKDGASDKTRTALEMMSDEFLKSRSLAKTIKECGLFDDYFIKMSELGELNGSLDKVTKELSAFYYKQNEFEERVRDSLSQPLTLLLMMILISAVIVFKIYPVFIDILLKMGLGMSDTTFIFMKLARYIAAAVMLVAVILSVAILIFMYTDRKNKDISRKMLEKLPFSGKLSLYTSLYKLSFGLSMFVKSGYPLNEGIKYLKDLTDNKEIRKKLEKIHTESEKGEAFDKALFEAELFEKEAASLLKMGLKTGHSIEAYENLEKHYQFKSDEYTDRLLNRIEPVFIGVLSLIVIIIVLSVMLPLLNISSLLA